MFTQIKTRKKTWEDLITPHRQKKAGNCFEDQLIGYNFLRNIWGTYFFDRQEISSEDKIDHINKIVGMMKAQIKLMISHQSNLIEKQTTQYQNEGSNQNFNFLMSQHQKIKQQLQRSRMREQQLYNHILIRQQKIHKLERQNQEQRSQLFELKQDKNKCEQKIIDLSNKVYQLQRGFNLSALTQLSQLDNTLDQFSAISVDREFSKGKPRVSLFPKRQNHNQLDNTFNDEVHSEQQDNDQKEVLCQLNLNLHRNRNPLKHSLQFHDKGKINMHCDFIQEMKRMKIKTQRIVQIENDRLSQRDSRRRTFTANALTFNADLKQKQNESRRFRRIRC